MIIKLTHYASGIVATQKCIVDSLVGYLLHNPEGPAFQRWYENGQIQEQSYSINGTYHNLDGPAYLEYFENGNIKYIEYIVNGLNHNISGPAVQMWYSDGSLKRESYWFSGVCYESLEKLQHAVKIGCLK